MKIHYGNLDAEIVRWVMKNAGPERIVSWDLETRVIDGNFLNNETILGISVSRRINKVENEVFVLEEESPEGELKLLTKLDDYLNKIRPLIIVGFNHRGYDNILLSTKMRTMKNAGLWAVKDTLWRPHMLDVMHAARFAVAEWDGTTPKILSLAKVIDHPKFVNLSLKGAKSLIDDRGDKGTQIYEMWKNNQEKFRKYSEGDSHDTLLIFEEIFGLNQSR